MNFYEEDTVEIKECSHHFQLEQLFEDIVKEDNSDIGALNTETRQLARLFGDVRKLLTAPGEQLQVIEKNMETALLDTEEATNVITQGSRQHGSLNTWSTSVGAAAAGAFLGASILGPIGLPLGATLGGVVGHSLNDFQKKSLETEILRQRLMKNWIRNEDVDACMKCGSAFSVLLRKHHCRVCGRIFCDACSSKKLPFRFPDEPEKNIRMERSCDFCYELHWNPNR